MAGLALEEVIGDSKIHFIIEDKRYEKMKKKRRNDL